MAACRMFAFGKISFAAQNGRGRLQNDVQFYDLQSLFHFYKAIMVLIDPRQADQGLSSGLLKPPTLHLRIPPTP